MTFRQFMVSAACLFAITFSLLVLTGVPPLSSLALSLFVIYQGVAGAVVWAWLRPTAPPMEHAGAALALGTAFAALAGVAIATLGLGAWGWALPSLLALAVVLRRRRSLTKRENLGWDNPTLFGFLAGLVPGIAIVLFALRSYPLSWLGSWSQYHPDMAFFEAISIHLGEYGAFSTPFLTEGAVRYHWLTYFWAGQLTLAADAPPFVTITRVLPVVALVGSAAMVASWTRQLSKQAWAPTLAGLLLSVGGFTGAVFGGVFTMDSPSQAMSVLWLIAFSILIVQLAQVSLMSWLPLSVVALLAFALVGGKVSAAAPAVAGVVLLSAIQILRRDRKVIGLLLATLVGAFAGFAFFLTGSLGGGGLTVGSLIDKASSQQGLNPTDSRYAVVAGTAILVLAVVPRWAGLVWLATRRGWLCRPEIIYSLGLAGSSLAALIVLNSFNEVWFSSTSSGPLAAISAVGAADALSRLARRSTASTTAILTVASTVALTSFGAVWLLWATGASGGNLWVPTWRWLGPLAMWGFALLGGILISWWALKQLRVGAVIAGAVIILVLASVPGRLLGLGTGLVGTQENGLRNEWFSVGEMKYAVGRDSESLDEWTESQLLAATWLRRKSSQPALLGTNLTFSPFVPAVTQTPTYVSGIRYQSPYGYPSMSPVMLNHEDIIWDFIDDPSSANLQPLCLAGVTWLWIDLNRTPVRDWEPFYVSRLTEEDTVIAEINPTACS